MRPQTARAAAEALVRAQWPEGTMARDLTCIEANTIAEFITEALGERASQTFLQAHSLSDGKDGLHYEMGQITQKQGIGWSA